SDYAVDLSGNDKRVRVVVVLCVFGKPVRIASSSARIRFLSSVSASPRHSCNDHRDRLDNDPALPVGSFFGRQVPFGVELDLAQCNVSRAGFGDRDLEYFKRQMLAPHKHSYLALSHMGTFGDPMNLFQDLSVPQHFGGDLIPDQKTRRAWKTPIMQASIALGTIWTLLALTGSGWI